MEEEEERREFKWSFSIFKHKGADSSVSNPMAKS